MFEDSELLNLDDDFLDGFADDSVETVFENETEDEEEDLYNSVEEDAQPQAEPTYTIKYNGQEQEVPVSELILNAQKGMNYDHVKEELERLRNDDSIRLIHELSQELGMSPSDYVRYIRESREQENIHAQVQQGIPESVARELNTYRQKESLRAQQETAQQMEQVRRAEYQKLAREFPDLKEFPPEVVEDIKNGERPYTAYVKYENAQLRRKAQTVQNNLYNRNRAIGSVMDSGAKAPKDDFMDGWNSV